MGCCGGCGGLDHQEDKKVEEQNQQQEKSTQE
ncbi:MAG: hypothetical protein ACI8UC_001547 [Psychromonas sp.]|jgi:hypothetical protein